MWFQRIPPFSSAFRPKQCFIEMERGISTPNWCFMALYVHKQPSIIQALKGMKMTLSCFSPYHCWAGNYYYHHCSDRVKELLMHTVGVSVRPLSVSDANRSCDPQHLERYVGGRRRGGGLTLMAQSSTTQTDKAKRVLKTQDCVKIWLTLKTCYLQQWGTTV